MTESYKSKNISYLIIFVTLISCLDMKINNFSVNYFFILLPIFQILYFKKFIKPPWYINLLIFYCILIFIIFFILRILDEYLIMRQTLSFLSFLTLFSFVTYKYPTKSIQAFKIGLILGASFISTNIINDLYSNNFETLLRGGYQRIGFILILGLLFLLDKDLKFPKILKITFITILSVSILLIQSRATYLTLLFCFVFFINKFSFKYYIFFILVSLIILYSEYEFLINYKNYLFNFLTSLKNLQILDTLQYEDSSEARRLKFLLKILDSNIIIFSNGFLGAWNFDEKFGSAHNQFLDVLIRIGIFGFIIYMYIIVKLLKFYKKFDKSIFISLIAMLVYGLFHETFKEPLGTYILSFILGYMFHFLRNNFKNYF